MSRRRTGVAVAAVAAGVLQAAPPAAAQVVAAAKPTRGVVAKVASRPDVVSARVAARAQGSRVEVESLRTGVSSSFVNPDGSLTLEAHAGPVRFRDARGAWQDVDLGLVQAADGSVAPRRDGRGVRLAGPRAAGAGSTAGLGSGELVSFGDGRGHRISVGWSEVLPRPRVSGQDAVYAGVASAHAPTGQMRVRVLRTGVEQFFTLDAAPAGAVSWQVPLSFPGLTARQDADGGISLVDGKGVVSGRVLPARMWDAVVDPRSGDHANTHPVALSLSGSGKGTATLTVTPDLAWLSDVFILSFGVG